MLKLAAAIICYNEEKNIERCLQGLIDCVDEVVVLDSFSTDRTKEICEKYSVRFIQREWEGYAHTKNQLNSLIEADFIFSVDADEVPDDLLKTEINKIKTSDFHGIYVVNRKTNYCRKWIKYCGWYPEYKARIFPKGKAEWTGDHVHEVLDYDRSLEVKYLDGHLEHYSYYTIEEHKERTEKYALLSAQKYHEEGRKAFLFTPFVSAVLKYLNILLLKRGFLDGYAGFQIACISARYNCIKYKELRRLNKTKQ